LLIGKFLLNTPSAKKKRIQVATKLAPYPWRIGNRGFNKPFLKSLERLNNKLDIVQLHWTTAKYNPWQELGLLNNLCDLKDQGIITEEIRKLYVGKIIKKDRSYGSSFIPVG